jgi:ubiquinone/menaquinone biosynthesis C-methylase UbiE
VVDLIFDEPRLADIYDVLDPDRSDLDVYAAIASELGAHRLVDVGCGTGDLACLLALEGFEVTAADPAAAMLAVARRKDGAALVDWIHGRATDIPDRDADLVTMTGNVAQVFLEDHEWAETLEASHRLLRPRGYLVFETRRPDRQAWLQWNPRESYRLVDIDGVGEVETWYEVTKVALPFVTFTGTIVFHSTDEVLVSESTLRFRTRDEVTASLDAAGFRVTDVRDAPDRPGNEYVFVATRR